MKVLHLIDSAGVYGAETMLLNLMGEQAALGLQPILASIGGRGLGEKALAREARRRGLRVESFFMRPGPNLIGMQALLSFARQEQVDLLHSHGYKCNILFGLLPRRLRGFPLITTVHGWTWTGGLSRMMIYEWLDSLALNFMDRIVLVSEAMREHPKLKGRLGRRADVVANGIPVEPGVNTCKATELDAELLAFCRGGYTIGAIGRLSREKGFDSLLRALPLLLKKRTDLRLVIIGEGGLRDELERLVAELGLEGKVLLPGYLKDAKLYLPYFRTFVISSLTEGLPMVLLEAMLAGIPVVSTSVGAVPVVLQQGKAGTLVAESSAACLAQGINDVMLDAALAAKLSETGRKVVSTSYSAGIMAANYRTVYELVLTESEKDSFQRVGRTNFN